MRYFNLAALLHFQLLINGRKSIGVINDFGKQELHNRDSAGNIYISTVYSWRSANMTQSNHRVRLLERWRINCLRSATGNYRAATKFSKRNLYLGFPSIVLSTLAGSSLFVTMQQGIEPLAQFFAGFVTLISAVLAALQTFMGSAERAGKHNAAAAEFNAVKRRIDFLIAKSADGGVLDDAIIEEIRSSMDTLSRETPAIPEKLWKNLLIDFPPNADN
jgi:hypothetical protein